MISSQKRHQLLLEVAGNHCPFHALIATSAPIARTLSSLDPRDLMGGDQEAFSEFIAEYIDEQDETPEGEVNYFVSQATQALHITVYICMYVSLFVGSCLAICLLWVIIK